MALLIYLWFALTLLGAVWMTFDLMRHTPAMGMMKPGWVLVALYCGPIGVLAYVLTCRQPGRGPATSDAAMDAHDEFIKPMWRQSMGSLVHCLAGDATGVIFAATLAAWLGLVGLAEAGLEYAFGFAIGLFVFQAMFMQSMLGGYWLAVKKTVYVEWVSMNFVMAGMIPVVMIGKSLIPEADHITSPDYWLIMQVGAIVGLAVGYPINYWLVSKGIKHGMMTQRPAGDHAMSHDAMQHDTHDHAGHDHHEHTMSHEHMHHEHDDPAHDAHAHHNHATEHDEHQHAHHGHDHHHPMDAQVSTTSRIIAAALSLIFLIAGMAIAVAVT